MKLRLIILLAVLSLVFFTNSVLSQDVKPYRIGLKIGLPNVAGLGLEYVIPLIDYRLAVDFDLSYVPISGIETDEYTIGVDFSYIGGGAVYYILQSGKGLYAGLQYGRVSTDISLTDIDKIIEGTHVTEGKADFPVGADIFQLKLGWRFIWGTFSLTPEIGYGFGKLDDKINYKVDYQNNKYNDSFKTSDIKIPLNEGVVGSITVGVAF